MYRTTIILLLIIISSSSVTAQRVDPYHLETGRYGIKLLDDKKTSLWWCEGAYKVMLDTPAPEKKSKTIKIMAAGNEYEPFQLILNPEDTLKNFSITIDKPVGPYGEISADNFEIRKVEYVNIRKPTDSYGYKGLWPDPLPLLEDSTNMLPGINNTIWISLYIPPSSMAGIYNTVVRLSADNWHTEIALNIRVWDFDLPEEASIRSGFGLSVDKIADYHNITDQNDLLKTFDLYMQAFRDYKISPYSFYYLQPIKKSTDGVFWKGGYYDSNMPYEGKYSLEIEDNSLTSAPGSHYLNKLEIDNKKSYTLSWVSRSLQKDQHYTIVVEAYDHNKNLLIFETKADFFEADIVWKKAQFKTGLFGEEVESISLSIYPSFRTAAGEMTGTVWFDNLSLSAAGGKNILSGGDFEIDVDSINILLDFKDFDIAAKRYLDEFKFNGFRLNLEGMGSGTYYSRTEGIFEGFKEGSEEYTKLMSQYLAEIQNHLEENAWLGKEYIYWFDEPGEKDYPFVRNGMELIKKSAPKISTFLTENDPGPEIMDVTDITCTILHRIDTGDVKDINARGQEYWSYICTGPKAPWISEFIDHDAINLRMWLWMSYSYKLSGILVWSTNYWTSRAASPEGILQNPWTEAASYVQGYGWPLGKQTNWGNGDGRFFYPPNRNPNIDKRTYIEGPIPSIRLEFLRQGIEDYEYLIMLEELIRDNDYLSKNLKKRAENILTIPDNIFIDGKTYTKNPADLMTRRIEIAEMILEIIDKSQ